MFFSSFSYVAHLVVLWRSERNAAHTYRGPARHAASAASHTSRVPSSRRTAPPRNTAVEGDGFAAKLQRSRSKDVVALVDAHLLDLGGTYGVPEAGDPIQYDELRIEHDQGDVEIVVYNRAILLFMTDSEPVRRVHEACLDDLATGRREA